MNDQETRFAIGAVLNTFPGQPLAESASSLLEVLGYTSKKRLRLKPNSLANFLATFSQGRAMKERYALSGEWKTVDFLFQLTGDEIRAAGNRTFDFDSGGTYNGTIINSYLFLALELKQSQYSRTALAGITREVNRLFDMPALILFRHGETVTLAVINRRLHRREAGKDVLEKVTLIHNIRCVNPHRAHIEILFDLSLGALHGRYGFSNFVELHDAWQKTLDTSTLNKRFYQELANWYFWARTQARFPKDAPKDSDGFDSLSVIRLITRVIFCWFLKEKGLLPEELFDPRKTPTLLKDFSLTGSTYYKAILQNLFFATLNQEMDKREFRKDGQHFMAHTLYRYRSLLKDPAEALRLFSGIPFMNGGLFECLDKTLGTKEKPEYVRIDGFSDRNDNPLKVPNDLFFGPERVVDLSNAYGDDKFDSARVEGLIRILDRYKFTVAENTPIEEEVALDPELLGKAFENLLAAYNPETGATARKQTGSFYTPREIVNYMVDESLIGSLETKLQGVCPDAGNIEQRIRHLIAWNDEPHEFTSPEVTVLIEAIDHLKILDPACGSGAFPMGILHKLVFVLGKLDPGNDRWKTRQIAKMDDPIMREQAEKVFRENYEDYGRKLYLIENCIYGVDIQPIAVQISKLRFFISLVVEQKTNPQVENLGIRPLPNLETKFVAADALIGIKRPGQQLLRNQEIDIKEAELRLVRERHFLARTPTTKAKCRDQDSKLRAEIAELLKNDNWDTETASRLADWDPYDQNRSAGFFDSEWMFGLDGFDIVIGNPPYISAVIHATDDNNKRDLLRSTYPLLKGAFDVYAAFLLQGIVLTTSAGSFSWIVPNKVLVSTYSKEVLKHLKSNGLRAAVDVSKYDVFESTGVYPVILIGNKGCRTFNEYEISALSDLPQNRLTIRASVREFRTFKDHHIKIASGTTGFQAQQIVQYMAETPSKKTIPFVVSGCVDRYEINYQNVRYMGRTYSQAFIRKGEALAESKWRFWSNAKIVIAGMTKVIEAVYCPEPLGLGVGVYAIYDYATFDPQFLLALLNSRYFSYYLNVKFQDKHLAGGYLAINKSTIEELPLVAASPQDQKPFVDLVIKRMAAKARGSMAEVNALEREIDKLVYLLFGLTAAEIQLVEVSAPGIV